MAKSYHDLVIKDGKFIGEFEQLYSEFDDPWMQSQQPNPYARMASIIHMKKLGIKSVLECGCGLGYYADWIRRETGVIPKSVDVSETAIEKAKKIFPDLDFEVADITKTLSDYKDLDAILFAEIIWYILPDLDQIFETMKAHFSGKTLIVTQVFYKGSQKYGNEYFTSLDEFIDYVPFDLIARCEATMAEDSTIETSTAFRIG